MPKTQIPVQMPVDCARVLQRLVEGWVPSFSLGRIASVSIPKVEVRLQASSAAFVGDLLRLELDVNDVAQGFGPIAATAAKATFDDGIGLEVRAVQTVSHTFDLTRSVEQLTLDIAEWELKDRNQQAVLWVAELEGNLGETIGNLLHEYSTTIEGVASAKTSTLRNFYLQGAYDYFLLQTPGPNAKWLLAVLPRLAVIDTSALRRDFLALQFSFGTSLKTLRFTGVDQGGKVVGEFGCPLGIAPNDGSLSQPVVPLTSQESWAPSLFQLLSRCLNSDEKSDLQVPISYYLRSLSGEPEAQILQACVGLESAAGIAGTKKTERFGLQLIEQTLHNLDARFSADTLRAIWDARNEVVHHGWIRARNAPADLIETAVAARSVLSTIVAAAVGYRGRMAGWPVKTGGYEARTFTHPWTVDLATVEASDRQYVVKSENIVQLGRAPIQLFVEGKTDAAIVQRLLRVAQLPLQDVQIIQLGGMWSPNALRPFLGTRPPEKQIFLIDADGRSIPDATAVVRKALRNDLVQVIPAVPTIEGWLFADEILARREAEAAGADAATLAILDRIPPPEQIPNPKALARRCFGPRTDWPFLENLDLERAMARSPSLRSFLSAIEVAFERAIPKISSGGFRTLSRDLVASLLAERLPADAVAWRTADGASWTAGELRKEIESGSELGREYATDLLRVARDLLARSAARKKEGS